MADTAAMGNQRDDRLSDADLSHLETLVEAASPAPWVASVEGRDHTSGDDVIMVGDPREEDMYVSRDSGPASDADLDLIALARTQLPALLAEVQRGRVAGAIVRDPDKRPFLAIDDYGTGGIWMFICARSADEIAERYPDLTLITEWREWMTPDRLLPIVAGLAPEMVFDIDQPHGWLKLYGESHEPPAG
jgi:hypothetical protein